MTACPTLALFLSLCAAPDVDAKTKQDLEKLQGVWVFDALKEDPQVKRAGKEWTRVEIDAKSMAITFGNGNTMKPRFSLDATQAPRHINFTFDETKRKDKFWYGIYQLDGDTLTLCFPVEPDTGKRPPDFTTPENSGFRRVVLKREKK